MISSLDIVTDIPTALQHSEHGKYALGRHKQSSRNDRELPCYATSAVYYCTNNDCTAFQMCARKVSPWSFD